MKKWVLGIILVLVIGAVVLIALRFFGGPEDTWVQEDNGTWTMHGDPEVKDFETCAQKYPVMESYPERCSMPDGPTFIKQY